MKLHRQYYFFSIVALIIFFGACNKNEEQSPNSISQSFSIYGTWNIDSINYYDYINDSLVDGIQIISSPFFIEFLSNGIAYFNSIHFIDTTIYYFDDSMNKLIIDMNRDNILDTAAFHKVEYNKCVFEGVFYKEIFGNNTYSTVGKYFITKIL